MIGSSFRHPVTTLVFRLQLWILLQHQIPDTTISSILGCDIRTVAVWKKKFNAGEDIRDKPRSGRPSIIPSAVDTRLLGFYCQHNPLPGFSRWSIRTAAKYLENHPNILDCSISRSSIHRLLKRHALKPYRVKYFLQISDPFFFPKMENIIKIYQIYYENLFCLDECTGLQALERKAPKLPSDGQSPVHIEPEYARHGTVSILSILQVSTGQVFTECIPDHTSLTVLSAVRNHVLQYDKSAELHYICDNYSSHSTEEFCEGIAKLCRINPPRLKTLKERRQWLESTNKRIVFHFLPTHGSWLNLIENWFGILQQKALKDESFLSTTDLENRIMNYTDTWNTEFAHPFRFSYTGEGLHGKVISRFTKWMHLRSPQLNAKFLEKQLELMLNLTTSYWPMAQRKKWDLLRTTLMENDNFIKGIIGENEKLNNLLIKLNGNLHNKLKVN